MESILSLRYLSQSGSNSLRANQSIINPAKAQYYAGAAEKILSVLGEPGRTPWFEISGAAVILRGVQDHGWFQEDRGFQKKGESNLARPAQMAHSIDLQHCAA